MKNKITLLTTSLLLSGSLVSNAAIFAISNVVTFTDDTLYADNNVPMTGGSVTIGYFGSTIVDTDIDTIDELVQLLGSFNVRSEATPGAVMGTFGFGSAGYADNFDTATSFGLINNTTNTSLLTRSIYSIVTSASSLATATASDKFALVKIGTIGNDEVGELTYSSNPAGIVPLIGSVGSVTTDLGIAFDDGNGNLVPIGTQTYSTLNLAAIPEPSTALLGALGALALLRRRRN
jgi:hypothetical protein